MKAELNQVGLSISILLGILFFSFVPESANLTLPIVGQAWDIFHVPAYTLLTIAILGLFVFFRGDILKKIGVTFLLVTMVGVMIEGLQQSLGRTMSWEDVFLNEIGIFVGLMIGYAWFGLIRRSL